MPFRSLFIFDDYKDYLRHRVENEPENWGLITRLAKAAGCQRSYLSRVMKGSVQLTPDQAFGLCAHWKLPPIEEEGFFCLVEISRSASPRFQAHLRAKFLALKRKHEDLGMRLAKSSLEPGEKEANYYSSWHWAALHIACSIEKLQTAQALAQSLQIPLSLVKKTLSRLESYGLVKQETPGRWVYRTSELHVPATSPLVTQHHSNWRQRALIDTQLRHEDSIHYTMVQSMNSVAFEAIRQKLLQFIDESTRIGGPSEPNELTCLTCDFFRP